MTGNDIVCLILQVYSTPFILSLSCLKNKLKLPQRSSFYIYCFGMEMIYGSQMIGIVLTMKGKLAGYCVLDVASYLYYCFISPTIYVVFLLSFFR
eukprot:m.19069 g.19069  ORF g.19069 m.19069 type:complete len:95 (+) comp27779_c0_seq5:627-911(+)